MVNTSRHGVAHARRRERQRGETTTQVVLLTPVLLVLVLVVTQMALLWHAAHLADGAATVAATSAARLGAGPADGMAAAASFSADAGVRLVGAPTVERTATSVIATIVVRVPHLLPGSPATVRRRVTVPVERFIPEGDR